MIIKIEDAPNIKHIKIDINFDDENNTSITMSDSELGMNKSDTSTKKKKPHIMDDIALDTDADADFNISTDVIEKPEIPDQKRDVKISDDMMDAEF